MGEERVEDASALVLDPHRFPGYELLGEIARGGMGVVFRARQLNPARLVALKVIAAGELASPRMVERFQLETEAAARLDHPNIVPIFEAGHQAGWHFFSMRLIEGGTLGEAMGAPQSLRPEESSASHGPQGLRRSGPREAAALMVKIARAVQHAHERGVLHRDLKPGNILLDAQGEPHLTDFGLAKMLAGDGDDGMTLSRAVLGTPAYMAPEQAEGGTRGATVAADVYGLGAVLYEMLAGCPPFAAASTAALLRKIAEDEAVAPSQRRRPSGANRDEKAAGQMPALPGDLDAICLKCLEKEPARRYPTAAALADDLERALRGEPIFAQPSTATQRVRKWVRRHPARSGLIVTAALAVVVITLGSLLFSVRVSRARAEARRQLVSKYLHDAAREAATGDAFSGVRSLAQAWRETDPGDPVRPRISERLNATFDLSPRLLRLRAVPGPPVRMEFSADGARLEIALRDGSALDWELRGNDLRALATNGPAPDSQEAAVPGSLTSPNGRWQLSVAGRRVSLRETATGRAFATYALTGPLHAMSFSPDSATFALAAFRDQAAVYESADGRPRGRRIDHESGANQARFSPDGALLVTAGFDYQLRLHTVADLRLAAPVFRHSSLVASVAFSPDGRLLAVGDVEGVVRVWDLQTAARQLLLKGEPLRRVALSPVGNLAVVVGGDGALQVCDLTTGEENGAAMPVPPTLGERRFDPAGRWLAVACRTSGARLFDFATRQMRHELKDAGAATADIAHVVFSPDGRALATATPRGVVQRWSVADGRPLGAEMAREEETFLLYWSGDGRWISAGGGRSVHVWDAATGALLGVPVRVNEGEHIEECEFSPDGRRLLVVFSNRSIQPAAGRLYDLPSLQPVGAPLRHGDGLRDAGFSPDGRFIVTVGEDNVARRWHARDGSPAGPAMRHADIVRGVVFGRDGRTLATGSADGMLRLWDPERAELTGPPLQFGAEVTSPRFNAAGDRLVFSVAGSQVWVVPLSTNAQPAAVQAALAELHSGLRLDASGSELSARELEDRFSTLAQLAPERTAWPAESRTWHQERAILAERRRDWFGAAFHLERLAALGGTSPALESRLARAREQLK